MALEALLDGPNVRARAGDQKEAQRLAAQLAAIATQRYVPACQFALVYAGIGDVDQAVKWIQKAYQERADFLLISKNEPLFDGLRSDRRFQDIERRIGLEP